jgi:hypothetical protein
MSGGRKFPPKMLEYLTNTQHTNLKDHHHQFIKTTLEILKNFLCVLQILGFPLSVQAAHW